MTTCGECGGEVSTKASACPKCGAKVSRTKWWLWVPLGLLVAFISFGAIIGQSPQAQEEAKEELAIQMCWEEYAQPSSANTQRFVASTCKMMEEELEKKRARQP